MLEQMRLLIVFLIIVNGCGLTGLRSLSVPGFRGSSVERLFVEQVPGDGSCLFHAVARGLHKLSETTPCDDTAIMLRTAAADVLEQRDGVLFAGSKHECQTWKCADIIDMMEKEYSLKRGTYCRCIRDPNVWGGGPEILALSNYLSIPISVYDLKSNANARRLMKWITAELCMFVFYGWA